MSSTIQTWAGLAGRRVLITGNSSDAVPSSGDHKGRFIGPDASKSLKTHCPLSCELHSGVLQYLADGIMRSGLIRSDHPGTMGTGLIRSSHPPCCLMDLCALSRMLLM